MKIRRKKKIIIPVIFIAIISGAYIVHRSFYAVPSDRLALNGTYDEMPEDSFHHYINLPVDYGNLNGKEFRGFYLLSPGFYRNRNSVTFLLTDGQMELVSTRTDFAFFENVLGGSAYVLIGVRGHSPTCLPEVYNDGNPDVKKAMRIYDSDQQVEDIERVRLDMLRKGLLSADAKINIFGASGAGVLAQQYVSVYGKHVHRMILESTGAPDLSASFQKHYAIDFSEYNPLADSVLKQVFEKKPDNKAVVCNILYQTGRLSKQPREDQLSITQKVQEGSWLLSYKFKPATNLSLLKYMVRAPKEIASRLRWFELVGGDLLSYDSGNGINLLYELSNTVLSDIVEYCRTTGSKPKHFVIDRNFKGEVLILKGTEDVVFSDFINQKLKEAYPNSALIFFRDGHRMQNQAGLYRQIRLDFFENGFSGPMLKDRFS